MKIHNFEQYSPEYWKIRALKLTASNAQAIGNIGKGLDSYCLQIVSEYFSTSQKEKYTNEDIERGNELEEVARSIYELETGNKVEEVGFVEKSKYVGCSPDGLVGDKGLVEIKCLKDEKHFTQILKSKTKEGIDIESKYFWQMQMQLYVTGRDWCDYVLFNPNFKENLLTKRVTKDEEKQAKIKLGLEAGEKIIKKLIKEYNGK